MTSLAQLPEQIAALPADMRQVCEQVLHVEQVCGYTLPPPAMYPWIVQHFGDVANVREQPIFKVTNRWTLESASFNPLRAKRPLDDDKQQTDQDAALAEAMAAYQGQNDTFDDPLNSTPADLFGRVVGEHCVTASNVAKYDGWHGLVVFDSFNPLVFTPAQFCDYCDVALRWLLLAHEQDPQACYPLITWNCLWKSGASVTHGHLQMVLARELVGGRIEQYRRARIAYQEAYGRSLGKDVWHIHTALGTTFLNSPPLSGYATLNTARLRQRLLPLWDATSRVLRAMIDRQGMQSFNLAITLPPLRHTPKPWGDSTVQVRIVDRGAPLSRAVNFGAMEVFAHSIIGVDPFAVAAQLQHCFTVR